MAIKGNRKEILLIALGGNALIQRDNKVRPVNEVT
jgi:carbamate kinase